VAEAGHNSQPRVSSAEAPLTKSTFKRKIVITWVVASGKRTQCYAVFSIVRCRMTVSASCGGIIHVNLGRKLSRMRHGALGFSGFCDLLRIQRVVIPYCWNLQARPYQEVRYLLSAVSGSRLHGPRSLTTRLDTWPLSFIEALISAHSPLFLSPI
jgi:hypothetical protein